MDSGLAKPRLRTGQGRSQPRRHRPIRPHVPPNSSVDTRAAMAAGKTKMKIDSKDFRVGEGDKVNLEKWPTKIEPVYKSKERYKSLLEEHVAKLSVMQELHYASNRQAVVVILQAIDAAGKDGAIRHVMSGVNPQGCRVYSFKQPSEAELEHDFLWRTRACPHLSQASAQTSCNPARKLRAVFS